MATKQIKQPPNVGYAELAARLDRTNELLEQIAGALAKRRAPAPPTGTVRLREARRRNV